MSDLRYPIGRFSIDQLDDTTTSSARTQRIAQLAETPARFERAIAGLSEAQLDTSYRPDGWTIRQLIHHMADSHVQAYEVFKRTLTEQEPVLRMYDSTAWGELDDSRTVSVKVSLDLLSALHVRWDKLLRSMSDEGFARAFDRPEWGGHITLDNLLQLLEWHQRHHLAHIYSVRERMGRSPSGTASKGEVTMRPLGYVGLLGFLGLLGLIDGLEGAYGLFGLFGFLGFFGYKRNQ